MSDLGIYWGGIPAALMIGKQPAKFAYRRARGVDPSTSEITFPKAMFRESLSPLLDANRFMPPEGSEPSQVSLVGTDTRTLFLPVDRPPYMADLVIVQGAGESQKVARARALYLDQAVVLNPRMEFPAVAFTLSDIRKWWANYGTPVTRSWNVRRGTARATSQGFGQAAIAVADPEGRIYTADTSKNGGRESYPLREIVQFLLDQLPGKLQILRWPAPVDVIGPTTIGEGEDAPEVKCTAASPKVALRELLEAFRLTLDIGPDLKARIYGPNEGAIGVLLPGDPENLSSYEPELKVGPWSPRVTADGNRYARRPTGAPARVVVVGDRTVFDVVQDFCTPVLVYPLERPGQPPETVVLEVTPGNLAALAQGERDPGRIVGAAGPAAPAPADTHDVHAVKVLMGAIAPPVPAVLFSGGGDSGPPAPVTTSTTDKTDPTRTVTFTTEGEPASSRARIDPFVWQRLPLLDDDQFEEAFQWLPLGSRKILRDQLWRYYQIPIRRLAPLLKRAERAVSGERLEIQVEAFTFRSVASRRLVPKDSAILDKQRQAEINQHKFLIDEIGRLTALRDGLKRPSVPAVLLAVLDYIRRDTGEASQTQTQAQANYTETLRLAGEAVEESCRGWLLMFPEGARRFLVRASLSAVVGFDEDQFIAEMEEELRKAQLAGEADLASEIMLIDAVFGNDSQVPYTPNPDLEIALSRNVATSAQRELRLSLVEDAIKEYSKAARSLFQRLFPVNAVMADLMRTEAAISAARIATGEDPESLIEERRKLREELARAERDEKQRRIEERKPRYESRVRHENLARQVVNARVIDAELGIIEVLGDLPCWLSDLSVKSVSSTYLIPMPVRVTHGSWNQKDIDTNPVPPAINPYLATSLVMILGMSAEARGLIGPIGHRLPANTGPGQFAVEYSRDGFARDPSPVPGAWLVTMNQSPPFRELVRLDGSSNREELEARARPLALSLLDTPDHTDAGSITLHKPENVGCNSRISAVEIRLVSVDEGDGVTFVTEVSFDGDSAPLPGIVGRDRDGGPTRLVFGLDPDATRDR